MTDFRGVLDKTTTSEGTFWHSAGIEDRLPGYVSAPAKPTGLSATPGSTSASLSWNAITGADSIAVYYREGTEGAFTLATAAVAGNATGYTLTGIDPETLHNWYITATNAGGTSEASDIDDFTTTAALSSTLNITGTGFGQGPIIYHFDRFAGEDREVITTSRTPDIGEYAATPNGTPRIYFDSQTGRTWFAHRNPNQLMESGQNMASLLVDLGGVVSTFRWGVRTWVPTDKYFPGATTTQTFPASSSWKVMWGSSINAEGNDLEGTDIPHRNVCFPTHIGSGNVNISGNSNTPRWYRDFPAGWQEFYTEMSHTAPTLHTFYQRGPGTHEVSDQPMEMIYVNGEGAGREVQNGDPFWSSSPDTSFDERGYEAIKIGAWFGQGPDYTNTLPLIGDVYIAHGTPENPERARACVIVGNATTLTGCTEAYLIPPDIWSDTAIGVTLVDHEDFGEDTHVHLILADGTLLQDVSFTRAE